MSGSVSSSTVEAEQQLVEATGEGDVVGVHERRHRQPRPVASPRREVAEEVGDLLGEHAVAHGAAVLLGRAVGLTPDPPGETERVEPVGPAVGLDDLGDQPAVVIGRGEPLVGAGHGKVGVADVPLAPVVGLVAAGTEPVAERRDLVGVEPAHAGVVRVLGHAVGLGHPVQRRVLPGEQRGPAGHAGRRPDVVAVQLHARRRGSAPGW